MKKALCAAEDCGAEVHALGLCYTHYRATWRTRKGKRKRVREIGLKSDAQRKDERSALEARGGKVLCEVLDLTPREICNFIRWKRGLTDRADAGIE